MKHFLFENRDNEIDVKFRSPKRKREQYYSLKGLRKFRKAFRRGGGKGGVSGKRRNDTRQKCVVKLQYSFSVEAHREQISRYLIREGTGKDGGPAFLFGTPLEAYKKHMAAKNFRIFLSPASNSVNLDVLAKTFIKKLELQTGKKLYWQAAEHYNTAHPHVHLLINGVSQTGEDLFFPPDLVKTFMRESARDICTALIGSRTKADMEQETKTAVTANRFTAIDEALKTFTVEGKVNLDMVKKNREKYAARLDHLRTLELCAWEGSGYVLSPGWEETLKALGKYNTFLNAKKHLTYTNEHNLKLYESGFGRKAGRAAKIYHTDEINDNHAVVLECTDGNAYYIPLFSKPSIREGETIILIPERNQKGRLRPVFRKASLVDLYREAEKYGHKSRYADVVRKSYAEERQNRTQGR